MRVLLLSLILVGAVLPSIAFACDDGKVDETAGASPAMSGGEGFVKNVEAPSGYLHPIQEPVKVNPADVASNSEDKITTDSQIVAQK